MKTSLNSATISSVRPHSDWKAEDHILVHSQVRIWPWYSYGDAVSRKLLIALNFPCPCCTTWQVYVNSSSRNSSEISQQYVFVPANTGYIRILQSHESYAELDWQSSQIGELLSYVVKWINFDCKCKKLRQSKISVDCTFTKALCTSQKYFWKILNHQNS